MADFLRQVRIDAGRIADSSVSALRVRERFYRADDRTLRAGNRTKNRVGGGHRDMGAGVGGGVRALVEV